MFQKNLSNEAFHLAAVYKTFPWKSILMQVVFSCFYPACFSLHGSIFWPDISGTEDILFFNVARPVIFYLGNMKSGVPDRGRRFLLLCACGEMDSNLECHIVNCWFVIEWDFSHGVHLFFCINSCRSFCVLFPAWWRMFIAILWTNFSEWCHATTCGP